MTTEICSEVPSTTLSTSAMAETRTPSAIARVTRNVAAATARMRAAKAFFDQRVGGKKISTEISRQQQNHDQHSCRSGSQRPAEEK